MDTKDKIEDKYGILLEDPTFEQMYSVLGGEKMIKIANDWYLLLNVKKDGMYIYYGETKIKVTDKFISNMNKLSALITEIKYEKHDDYEKFLSSYKTNWFEVAWICSITLLSVAIILNLFL